MREEDFWHGFQRLKRVLVDGEHVKGNPFEMPKGGVDKTMKKRHLSRKDDRKPSGLVAHPQVNLPNPSFGK